tara:strand:- start:1885 stop:2286 length:402 start_codon:yes stop_codon:yes gene_type:complete
MIVSKINKTLLILSVFFLTQCYTEPFFELTVQVFDGNLNPVPDTEVKIEITDIENGNLVSGSIITQSGTTGSDGRVSFSFENKAFVTARACLNTSSGQSSIYMCNESNVYLEENTNKDLSLMLQANNCAYCNL